MYLSTLLIVSDRIIFFGFILKEFHRKVISSRFYIENSNYRNRMYSKISLTLPLPIDIVLKMITYVRSLNTSLMLINNRSTINLNPNHRLLQSHNNQDLNHNLSLYQHNLQLFNKDNNNNNSHKLNQDLNNNNNHNL